MDRTAFLRSLIDVGGKGLEIGPGCHPLLPKAQGFAVQTVDYLDADGLRRKYHGNPHVDLGAIEEVDHVLDGAAKLDEQVGQSGLDYIVASHVIEHLPDVIAFLAACEAMLKPEGKLLLAVPDKRCCFDVLQPPATTGAMLQARLDGRSHPSPGAAFDDCAYSAVRGQDIAWPLQATGALSFFAGLQHAKSVFDSVRQTGAYADVHVWRFVPSSFRLIMRDLHEIGETGLKESAFHGPAGHEFYATYSKAGAGCPVDRLTLAVNAVREQAAISAVLPA